MGAHGVTDDTLDNDGGGLADPAGGVEAVGPLVAGAGPEALAEMADERGLAAEARVEGADRHAGAAEDGGDAEAGQSVF